MTRVGASGRLCWLVFTAETLISIVGVAVFRVDTGNKIIYQDAQY